MALDRFEPAYRIGETLGTPIRPRRSFLDTPWFSSLALGWGAFQTQADAVEFAEWLMRWCQAPAFHTQWERRVHTDELGVHAEDKSCANAPLIFHQPDIQHSPLYITLQSLCDLWAKVDRMCTALSHVPEILRIHFSRTYQDDDQATFKSFRALVCDDDLQVPVLTGMDTQVTYHSFTVIAATEHLGQTGAGHYRAALRVKDDQGRTCWALTDDAENAVLRPRWPSWFISNVTLLWLTPHAVPQLPLEYPSEYDESGGDRLLHLLSK